MFQMHVHKWRAWDWEDSHSTGGCSQFARGCVTKEHSRFSGTLNYDIDICLEFSSSVIQFLKLK